ncbi:MAG: type II toxin-antitoxin system RelE/ParE family toxin [Planctomyces sp.]|nr:type II toxin-antitoxin system RelE/ParE family toxin [Planctomyces sp.]
MTFRLTILPQAKEDLRRNAAWWAENHSVEQAARWLDAIQSQLESIMNSPESYSLSAENDEFPYEIRDKLLGLGTRPSHRAVFTIKDDTIFVLTVQRSAQDVLRPSDVESPPGRKPNN